jgi:formate-dependent nitrite reductase membrane component NrfD
VLLLGVLCLLFDLGRPDRLLFLFLRPAPGYLVLGTYALVILIACTIVLCLIWGDPFARFPRWAVRAAEALGLLTAFAAMLYTGLLFQSIGTGTLLEMLLIPVIFVLSSLSTGIALLLLTTALTRVGRLFSTTLARLVRADVVLILLEGVGLALLLAFGLNGQQTQTATAELISGDFALVFWVGVVGCGLIAPLGFEGVSLRSDASGAPGARGVRGMSTRGMSSARATRAVSTGGMSSARATSGTSGRVIGMTPRREYTFVPVSLLLLIGGYCLRVALLGAGLPLFMAAAMTTTTLGALAV